MPGVQRGAVVDSIQRLFDRGTLLALGERQLLDRFLSRGDESAFEAIVGRHGPMVLSVCRRVLADQHDVEDAFQATFLILVKKAGSIRERDVLGAWLHGVAHRVAARARASSRRRQARERVGLESSEMQDRHIDPVESNEIRAVLDDELERLPYRYRAALVLCDMEGQTHEQAAAQLRCPVGTVKSRLSRGRARLRARLARRGLAAPLLVPGNPLAMVPAPAVPVKLLCQTTRAARGLATKGTVTAGSITAGTAFLTEGVIRTMAITTPKMIAMTFLATTITIGGACLTAGPRPLERGPVERNARARIEVAQNSVTQSTPPPTKPVNPELKRLPREEYPQRGALRVVRLKHAGDWNIAEEAIPKLMDTLSKPPLSLDVMKSQKDLSARDPDLIYYPLIYMQGRGRFSVPKEDLEALRTYFDPGAGTLFADANLGSPEFDASFRRLVTQLFPNKTLVPIPKDDPLYSAKVGYDLSKVRFTWALGAGRGFPQLEGVKINDHWAVIYSKFDISSALEGKNDVKTRGYTPASARMIAANVVIYCTLP